ncbi:hypothetical protein [Gordonia sp. VNK21]|uniref:hypothetical protein n=1 Tax=Gordonia sp. VNK21 TaxID=3382483 RepID=UPI0038D4CFBC
MNARRSGRAPVRGYGITAWGRAFVDPVEAEADHRHITGARRYFRDRHVDSLTILPGRITAAVRGSQLDPFTVTVQPRRIDPPTVVDLLRGTGRLDALLELARGEQPAALRELIAPTEPADVPSSCTCPDEAPRCIHVLATVFEVAARIDRRPTTLLHAMGTDLPELLALARGGDDDGESDAATGEEGGPGRPIVREDWYGDRTPLPAAPVFGTVDPLTELEPAALRRALRASGVPATVIAEAVDDLAELYRLLTGP